MRNAVVFLLAGLTLLGCNTLGFGGGGRKSGTTLATPLQQRDMQTRTYDTQDTTLVMKAMLNVLQDLGFVVKNVDADLGFLTAERWTQIEHSKREMKKAAKKRKSLARTQVLECTANVSAFGQRCRVRVTFQQRTIDAHGASLNARPVLDPGTYQMFHSNVGKSVFLQKEGV